MKPGGGKSKGSSFERLVCRELSLWISGGHRTDLLWRSAMSGGRGTIQGAKNKTQQGDISSIHPAAAWMIEHFQIECKTYTDLNVGQSFILGHGRLIDFWRELERQCNSRLPEIINPLLIAKQSRWPIIVLMKKVSFMPELNLPDDKVLVALPDGTKVALFESFLSLPCPFRGRIARLA